MHQEKAQTVARMGMLFALAIVLSWLESLVVPLLGLMPGLKIGLSNVVVMYALLLLRRRDALALVVLKALFAFATRGATAGLLSFCGGAFSFLVMCLLLFGPWHRRQSGFILSVCGALAHNLGQLLAACFVLGSTLVLGYAPLLMLSGLVVGYLTWWVLRLLLPTLRRFTPDINGKVHR